MKTMKRIRSSNWNKSEKKVLRMLVLERADIIENKDTSTNINSAKKAAWKEVWLRFNAITANSSNANKRDMAQLLTQWRNMKNKAKMAGKIDFPYRSTITGSGSLSSSPSHEDRDLMEAIPNMCVADLDCYDSDTIHIKKPEMSQSGQNTSSSHPGPSIWVKKHLNSKTDCTVPCCNETHEHQLFLLDKTSRENAMLQEKEAYELKMRNERQIHEKRMAVMSLEEEYWRTKINNIK